MNRPVVDEPIAAAVAAAYAAAGREPGNDGPVAPLRHLITESGLIVDEVDDLSLRVAAAYLEGRTGRRFLDHADNDAALAGFLFANANGGWVLVNRADPLARRRFSIAHELGHYRLHFLPLLAEAADHAELELAERLPSEGDEMTSTGEIALPQANGAALDLNAVRARLETEADQFAAALLMPASVCAALMREHGPRCGGKRVVLARRLASTLLVSQAAARRRLADLGLGEGSDD